MKGEILRIVALLAMVSGAACEGDGGVGSVALRGDSVSARTGEVVRMCIELDTGGRAIAATQNDLGWDPSCLSLVDQCVVDAATGKQLLTNHRGDELRAIVISLSDTNPIPAGPLYCCSMRVSAASGCCTVEIFGTSASDPEGQAVAMGASDGEVCIE